MRTVRRRNWALLVGLTYAVVGASGCAAMRFRDPNPDLRPCTDGYAHTADGWNLGIRHIRPERPDPGKYPVVLCHGLGLNGTFWTITDNHLPGQLADRGYEVFVVDLRGSGASYRDGRIGKVNKLLRETPFLEIGEGSWNMDHEAFQDVPAILDYVHATTGSRRVNWVGHSMGGMLMYAYLERAPEPERIATFVSMGATAYIDGAPSSKMLKAGRGLMVLLRGLSPARMSRMMKYARPPGLDAIDSLYFTQENVDKRTVSRFYGSTLENPGRGALKQMDPYLEFGRMVSADGTFDYTTELGKIKTPILIIAGEGDVMADIPSMQRTFDDLGSPDKIMMRFGKRAGQIADYGHCDLVWSRYAPAEIFPPLQDWLDSRQPGVLLATEQADQPSPQAQGRAATPSASPQDRVDADLRPGLEPVTDRR